MNRRSLAVGAISGALSFGACLITDRGSAWAPGLIFGALVLAPSFAGGSRRAGLFAASTLIYRAAVWFASTLYVQLSGWLIPACTLAGGLGALALAVATTAITRAPLDVGATRRSVVAGMVAGAFLDGYLRFGDDQRYLDYIAIAVCFIGWQASYAALHGLAPWRALPAARAAQ